MAQESAADDLMYVDDFFLSMLFDVEEEDESLPLSDEKYAEELQFQEVLMGSLTSSQNANKGASSSSSSVSLPLIQETSSTQNPEPVGETKEAGQSSSCFCEICADRKDGEEMFKNHSCVHSFCSDCISKHVATKIQESVAVVYCPEVGCEAVLTIDDCRRVLPNEVQERWDKVLCETQILPFQTFYCPFKDCSAVLENDNEGEVIRESECPSCHRLFCAQCYVAWHPGVDCEEYQRLNEDERGRDDLMVRELARERRWMRCPRCKYYVEKTEGCLHITCRCTFQFCYGCGENWTADHGGCQRN